MIGLTAFTATAALFASGALWLAGSKGVLEVLTFRGATGWQIESLVGSLIHLTGSETLRMESGAWRIGTINGAASISLFAAAAPICIWSSWRGARSIASAPDGSPACRRCSSLRAALSSVCDLARARGGNRLGRGDTHLAVITAIAILLTQIFWICTGASRKVLPALLTVVVRNAVLIALALSAVARLAHIQNNRMKPGRTLSASFFSAICAAVFFLGHTTGRHRKNQIASTA